MAEPRLYLVRIDQPATFLVRAYSRGGARRYAAQKAVTAIAPTQEQLIECGVLQIPVIDATLPTTDDDS